ncbi:MAG TPA: hypothetical protein VIS99_03655 [Terrimicrobiaceae bacterium]
MVALVVGLAITVGSLYFALIDWRVRSIVKDPDFVAEVARRARPALVFDSEGRVLADTGALAFLKDTPRVESAGNQTKVTIDPRNALPAEPILQALDQGNVSVTVKRGSGISWEIVIAARSILLTTEDVPSNLAPPRFRIEIVPP